MHKKQWQHTFDFNLDTLVNARAARYENPEWWKEIKESQILQQEEKDGLLYIKRQVWMMINLPSFAEKAIPNQAFEVLEESWYDKTKNEMHLKTTNGSYTKYFEFHEDSHYYISGEHESKRDVKVELEVKVPLVGRRIEKMAADEFKKQSDKDKEVIDQYVNNLSKST